MGKKADQKRQQAKTTVSSPSKRALSRRRDQDMHFEWDTPDYYPEMDSPDTLSNIYTRARTASAMDAANETIRFNNRDIEIDSAGKSPSAPDTWSDRLSRYSILIGIFAYIANIYQYWKSDLTRLSLGGLGLAGVTIFGGWPLILAITGLAVLMSVHSWYQRRREQKLFKEFVAIGKKRRELWAAIHNFNVNDISFIDTTINEIQARFSELRDAIDNSDDDGHLSFLTNRLAKRWKQISGTRAYNAFEKISAKAYPLIAAIGATFATIYFFRTVLPVILSIFKPSLSTFVLPWPILLVILPLTFIRVIFSERHSTRQAEELTKFSKESEYELELMKHTLLALYCKRYRELIIQSRCIAEDAYEDFVDNDEALVSKTVLQGIDEYVIARQAAELNTSWTVKLRIGLIKGARTVLAGLMNAASIYYGIPFLFGLMGVVVAPLTALVVAVVVGAVVVAYKGYHHYTKFNLEQRNRSHMIHYDSIHAFQEQYSLVRNKKGQVEFHKKSMDNDASNDSPYTSIIQGLDQPRVKPAPTSELREASSGTRHAQQDVKYFKRESMSLRDLHFYGSKQMKADVEIDSGRSSSLSNSG